MVQLVLSIFSDIIHEQKEIYENKFYINLNIKSNQIKSNSGFNCNITKIMQWKRLKINLKKKICAI